MQMFLKVSADARRLPPYDRRRLQMLLHALHAGSLAVKQSKIARYPVVMSLFQTVLMYDHNILHPRAKI